MSAPATLPPPYTSPATIDETRREVEGLVCGLPGGDPDQLGFRYPWEIRAFSMAVTAHRRLGFEWSEFQAALIASIQDWERTGPGSGVPWSYYEHWVAALETVMTRQGVLGEADLDERTRQVLAIPANRNHREAHTEPIAVDPARTVPA